MTSANSITKLVSTPLVGSQTQSIDTAVEAELVQFQMWRQMTLAQKEALFCRAQRKLPQLMPQQIQTQFVDIPIKQIRTIFNGDKVKLGQT